MKELDVNFEAKEMGDEEKQQQENQQMKTPSEPIESRK